MNHLNKAIALLLTFFVLISCGKKGSGNGVTEQPTNLVISATVSTDSSGKVAFSATADKAVSYVYDFGNGDIKTVASGNISYQYTTVGHNTFTVVVTASGNTGLTMKKTIQVTVDVRATAPTIFWSDEFDKDGAPDSTKWDYDIGTGSNGWGNAELEYYTSRPENVIVQNGALKIVARKESFNGRLYTSARLLSKNKFAFALGKVEIRAKIASAVGTWPALWMLGSNIDAVGWPACGEIDIMEARGNEPNKIFGTLHYPGRSGGNADGSTTIITNASTEFHIYSLDWTADAIKISVDGQQFHTVLNSGSIPFNHDFFFIMNLAMGGNFAGGVDPGFTSDSLVVDYIRVYK